MANKEIKPRYAINIYCGGVFCGNGYFETEEEAINWFREDAFCDKARITNLETGKRHTIKMEKP